VDWATGVHEPALLQAEYAEYPQSEAVATLYTVPLVLPVLWFTFVQEATGFQPLQPEYAQAEEVATV
jgi:hypothetical protein